MVDKTLKVLATTPEQARAWCPVYRTTGQSSGRVGGRSRPTFCGGQPKADMSRKNHAVQRIQKEMLELIKQPLAYVSAGPDDESDLTRWSATIAGPKGTTKAESSS